MRKAKCHIKYIQEFLTALDCSFHTLNGHFGCLSGGEIKFCYECIGFFSSSHFFPPGEQFVESTSHFLRHLELWRHEENKSDLGWAQRLLKTVKLHSWQRQTASQGVYMYKGLQHGSFVAEYLTVLAALGKYVSNCYEPKKMKMLLSSFKETNCISCNILQTATLFNLSAQYFKDNQPTGGWVGGGVLVKILGYVPAAPGLNLPGHMRVMASTELVHGSFCHHNKNGLICWTLGKSSRTSPGPSSDWFL